MHTQAYVVIRPVLELNKTGWPYIIIAMPRQEPGCLCLAHGFRGFGLGLARGIVFLLRGWHLRENAQAKQDQALFPWRRNPLPADTGRSESLSVLTVPEIRPGVAWPVASKLFSTRCCFCALSPLPQGLAFQRRNLFSSIH